MSRTMVCMCAMSDAYVSFPQIVLFNQFICSKKESVMNDDSSAVEGVLGHQIAETEFRRWKLFDDVNESFPKLLHRQ